MSINLTWKKLLISLAIIIGLIGISFVIGIFVGKDIEFKKLGESQTKLEKDLEKANNIIKEMEEKNENLIKLNDEQNQINEELRIENEKMKSDLNNIKKATDSTKIKLDEVDNIVDESMSTIQKLKENQKIFREYFEDINDVIGE